MIINSRFFRFRKMTEGYVAAHGIFEDCDDPMNPGYNTLDKAQCEKLAKELDEMIDKLKEGAHRLRELSRDTP